MLKMLLLRLHLHMEKRLHSHMEVVLAMNLNEHVDYIHFTPTTPTCRCEWVLPVLTYLPCNILLFLHVMVQRTDLMRCILRNSIMLIEMI